MKLKEFMQNPVGKGDSTYARNLLIQALDAKYDRLIKNKGDLIKVKFFHELTTDNYYIHLVIPSETERDNTYDVVLYFYTTEHVDGSSLLNTHDIKVFCNAPSFAYTYAKVFNDNGMLIPWLTDKFPSEIFSSAPEVRNRYGVTNYDKYLYIGCKYIVDMRLLNRATLSIKSINFTNIVMSRGIRTLDKIMIDYKKAEHKIKETRIDKTRKAINDATGKKPKTTGENKAVNVVNKTSAKKTSIKKINKVKKI